MLYVAGAMMCNNDFTNIMNVYVTIAIMIVKGHTRAHSHKRMHTHTHTHGLGGFGMEGVSGNPRNALKLPLQSILFY